MHKQIFVSCQHILSLKNKGNINCKDTYAKKKGMEKNHEVVQYIKLKLRLATKDIYIANIC